jgi:hypothetical protein
MPVVSDNVRLIMALELGSLEEEDIFEAAAAVYITGLHMSTGSYGRFVQSVVDQIGEEEFDKIVKRRL